MLTSLTTRVASISVRSIQERKELPVHWLAGGDRRDAGQKRFIRAGADAVAEGVHDHRAARAIGAILERTVNHQRMVKRALSFLQLDRLRLKLPSCSGVSTSRIASMPPARPVTGSKSQRWLRGMYCRQPLSRSASSSPIQQVRCAIGRVRVQYE